MEQKQEPEIVIRADSKPEELVAAVARVLDLGIEDIVWSAFGNLNSLEMYLDERPTKEQEEKLTTLFSLLQHIAPSARLIYPMGDLERRCPAHGLVLLPWRRVGKVECPDSSCMYAEPHICEQLRIPCECEQGWEEVVQFTPRKIPACDKCTIVTDPPPHPRIKVGDAQCSGRCFDYDAWLAWKQEVEKLRCPFSP